MTPTQQRDRALANLAAAFNRRRCWCGEPARAIRPGFPPVIEGDEIVRPATPSLNFCLRHAFSGGRRARGAA